MEVRAAWSPDTGRRRPISAARYHIRPVDALLVRLEINGVGQSAPGTSNLQILVVPVPVTDCSLARLTPSQVCCAVEHRLSYRVITQRYLASLVVVYAKHSVHASHAFVQVHICVLRMLMGSFAAAIFFESAMLVWMHAWWCE